MLASIFGTDSLYVLIIAIVVLFGGSQLPKLARNAGEAMKEFRKSHDDADSPSSAPAPAAPAPVALPPAAAVVAPPVVPVAAPPAAAAAPAVAPGTEERVTLTRSELDALLADRENRARAASTQEGQK